MEYELAKAAFFMFIGGLSGYFFHKIRAEKKARKGTLS